MTVLSSYWKSSWRINVKSYSGRYLTLYVKLYLHFLSFFETGMALVVKIIHWGRRAMCILWERLWLLAMIMSWNGNICRVTGPLCRELTGHRWIPHTQKPVTRSFDVSFDLRLNQHLRKQWRRGWFEMPSRSLWRQCNVTWRHNEPDHQQAISSGMCWPHMMTSSNGNIFRVIGLSCVEFTSHKFSETLA